MKDSDLDQLLKKCDPQIKTSPNFRSEVWLRIASADSARRQPPFRQLLARMLESFTLPPVAAAICAAAILAGIALGMMPGKSNPANDSAYLQSISPFIHPSR